jgi:hypothetical protein
MTESTDQYSDTGSDLNWPLDHTMERQNFDQVVFENVADQYVKGDDVTAFFTVVHDTKDNSDEHEIGLFRVCFFVFFKKYFYLFTLLGWLYQYKRVFSICFCRI